MKNFHNVDKDDDLEMIVDKTPTKKSSTIKCQVMPSKNKPKPKTLSKPEPNKQFRVQFKCAQCDFVAYEVAILKEHTKMHDAKTSETGKVSDKTKVKVLGTHN